MHIDAWGIAVPQTHLNENKAILCTDQRLHSSSAPIIVKEEAADRRRDTQMQLLHQDEGAAVPGPHNHDSEGTHARYHVRYTTG